MRVCWQLELHVLGEEKEKQREIDPGLGKQVTERQRKRKVRQDTTRGRGEERMVLTKIICSFIHLKSIKKQERYNKH